MPDRASRSDAVTSSASLPMEETMPRPVTQPVSCQMTFSSIEPAGVARSSVGLFLEEADPEIGAL